MRRRSPAISHRAGKRFRSNSNARPPNRKGLQKRVFQIIREEAESAVAEKKIRELVSEQLAGLTDAPKNALGVSDAMLDEQIKLRRSRLKP